MDTAERLLAGHVVHEDEAHGAPVVGGGDGPVALLAGSVLEHQKTISASLRVYQILNIALHNSSYFFSLLLFNANLPFSLSELWQTRKIKCISLSFDCWEASIWWRGEWLLASLRKDHYRIINSQHLSRLPSGPPSVISLSFETLFQLINPPVREDFWHPI